MGKKLHLHLKDFGNRLCKRESVQCDALKEWKLSILNVVDKHIKFYSHYENTPMQYTAIFHGSKNDFFLDKKLINFLFLLKTYIVSTR